MGDHHWYYHNLNYPPPGVPEYNYQVYPQEQQPQYHQWPDQSTSQYIQCPPVPSYPPPVAGPYSVPPPNITPQVNYEYIHNYNCVPQVNQNHFYEVKPPNDYTKELENYKYIKSKIEDDSLGGKKTRESMDPNGNGGSSSKEAIMIPMKSESEYSEDLDFVYGDSDTHANEIAEFYSYSELADFNLNLTAYEELVNPCRSSNLSWKQLSIEHKYSVIMKILDQLECSNREIRMKSARCILYIAQGGWSGIQCEGEQMESAIKNCFLLYKLGAFNAFIDLLNLEIDLKAVVNKASISLVDSDNLRVILSVLYTITEVIRCQKEKEPTLYKAFCSEIMTMVDDIIIVKLFTMLTKFCSGSSPHYPVKKILLLLWKLILIGLGDSEELKKLKIEKRKNNGLPPENEDTLEIIQKMRPSSPPTFPPDLLEDQNQRRRRNLVKQNSLDENETIEMDLYENEEIDMKNKAIPHLNRWQDFILFSSKQEYLKLPWKTKTHKKEIDSFLNAAREKFIGFSLEGDYTSYFGLPEPIHDSVNVLKEHIFTSLSELEIQQEENINRNPFTTKDKIELNSTEILYQAMFPNLSQYMICLLKILLATTSRVKTTNDSINLLGDVLPKEMPTTVFQSMKLGIDVNRHKEIIVKAVSAILLLLLKHFKLNHIYQFEFMAQHLVFANCIPLILKFFNQEVINFVKAGNCIPLLDFPFCVLGDFQPEMTGGIEIGCDMKYCWRNIFSSINLLRVLNKLCKWKNSRIMMLVIFKSAPILKRTLKIRQAMAQLYVLKLLKMQSKYLGRNWRKTNLKTVSLIYQKVRHHLNDDWAYGNFLDAKPWDFQSEEITLRTAVDKFNNRRYVKNIDIDFEPVDNNIVSVLGHDFNLSDSFHKNYYLWLENEVFNNIIQWDDLF